MRKVIPYGKQHVTDEDVQQVAKVLRSDFLTQGPLVKEFEVAFAEYVGSKHAVAVSSGTAALHLSTLALGVEKGEKVITTPITFAASANCVLYGGGEVSFVDIDPSSYLIDLTLLEKKLSTGEYSGIIPVDFAGMAVDMERVRQLADRYGCWILEDACHAPGGSFINSDNAEVRCGDGKYADAAIFSFHPVKHIAAGEGGMVTTNDPELADRIRMLRSHGITKDPEKLENHEGGWYYEMQALGYNYRLTDIQAALGLSQLKRASEGLKIRRELADKYIEAFESIEEIKVQTNQRFSDIDHHAYHLFVIQVEQRRELYDYLKDHQVFAQIHYIPIYKLPYYKNKYGPIKLSNAEKYYESCISLPLYPTLSEEDQSYIINLINKFYAK